MTPADPDWDPLTWVEDFREAWAAVPGAEREQLRRLIRQVNEDGRAIGGLWCCGTRSAWHRPWCAIGPGRRRYAETP